MLPPLDASAFELTLEQQFNLRNYGDAIKNLNKEQLEELATQVTRQNMILHNVLKNMIKNR